MADEREGVPAPRQDAADKDKIQTGGREANAAQPLNAAKDHGGAERYPAADRTDAVEHRSFDPAADAPTPRQGAGDGSSTPDAGFGGAKADPVEGRR
jgi:hypothetical protein